MNNQKILFLKGLPASGKSSFARQYCIDNPEFVRINKDDIREELGNLPYSRELEDKVLEIQRNRGSEILKSGKSLIVDDTNFSKIHEKFWRDFCKKNIDTAVIEFEIKMFDTPLEECIQRDKERQKSVGESVIRKMHETYFNS